MGTPRAPLARERDQEVVALATVGKQGLEVRLKLFVNTGGNIEIDTRTGEYRCRV
jgi:hypothetical protein